VPPEFIPSSPLGGSGLLAPPDLVMAARFTFRVGSFGFASSFTGMPQFTVTKAASSETIQWGAGLVFDVSFLAGVPNTILWGRPDDTRNGGVIVDGPSTQLVLDPRNFGTANWALGGGASRAQVPAQTTPLGGTNAWRVDAPSGVFGVGENAASGSAGVVTVSSYVLSANGGPPGFNLFLTPTPRVPNNGGAAASWARLAATGTATSSSAIVPVDGRDQTAFGGLAPGARSAYVDFAQREALPFATEWFPSGTRPARYLTMGAAYVAPFISGGQLGIELVYAPRGAVGYAGTAYLWWMDANNYIALNCATGVLTVRVGGVNNTTSPVAWSALEELRFFVQFGGGLPTVVALMRSGGAVTKCSITGSPLGTVTATNANILSDNASGHVYGYVYDINFAQPRRQPAWAV